MFEVAHNPDTGKTIGVRRLADGATIPMAVTNRDWRKFLEWNAAQPVPLDLSDLPPPPPKTPRPDADILADLDLALDDAAKRKNILKRLALAAIKQKRDLLQGIVEGET